MRLLWLVHIISLFYIEISRKIGDQRRVHANQGVWPNSLIPCSCRADHTSTMAETRISKMITSNSDTNIAPCTSTTSTITYTSLRRFVESIAVVLICRKNFLRLTFFFFFFFLCICFSRLSQLESTSDLYDEWSHKRRHYCNYTK
jgi:hypothetical protein